MLAFVSSRYIKFTITLQFLVCSPKSPNVPVPGQKNIITPLVQCTNHMCPIKIQWHLKLNSKDYWRVRITVRNLNYHMNYKQWNLVVQHPNLDNLTRVFGSKYTALTPQLTTSSKSHISLWLILHASIIYYCIFFYHWNERIGVSSYHIETFRTPQMILPCCGELSTTMMC